ncbi:MAG: hypothetical protein K0S11_1033 [Gammaproteobacteria bacterium]|nr:hypothetical protein [Gammaproteobacteria bacterium]
MMSLNSLNPLIKKNMTDYNSQTDTQVIPSLSKGEIFVFSLAEQNKSFISSGLSLNFIKKIANKLEELSSKKILNESILTVLAVNPAGVVLHQACFDPVSNFNAILKPIFLKEKSITNSIASPFLNVFDNEAMAQFNQKLSTSNMEFAAVGLEYPIEHLKKLAELGYITISRVNRKQLTIKEEGKEYTVNLAINKKINSDEDYLESSHLKRLHQLGYVTIKRLNNNQVKIMEKTKYYKIQLPKKIKKMLPASNEFFQSEYYSANSQQLVKVFYASQDDKIKEPVIVLGLKSDETHHQPWPIVCDVDAHNFAARSKEKVLTYDTSMDSERNELKEKVKELLDNKLESQEIENYLDIINDNLGRISAQELIVYYAINSACDRNAGLLAVFQHGATANMGKEDVKKIPQRNVDKPFPAIEDKTEIVAILPQSKNNFLVVQGAYTLLLYDILKSEGHYNFKMQYLWKKQLEEFAKYPKIEKIKRHIREKLHEVGIGLENLVLKRHQHSIVSVATAASAIGIFGVCEYLKASSSTSHSDTLLSTVNGVLGGCIVSELTRNILQAQIEPDMSTNPRPRCSIM